MLDFVFQQVLEPDCPPPSYDTLCEVYSRLNFLQHSNQMITPDYKAVSCFFTGFVDSTTGWQVLGAAASIISMTGLNLAELVIIGPPPL